MFMMTKQVELLRHTVKELHSQVCGINLNYIAMQITMQNETGGTTPLCEIQLLSSHNKVLFHYLFYTMRVLHCTIDMELYVAGIS